jgi:hypothetical protein
MTFDKSLLIRQLDESDAAALSGFMRSQSPEYLRFFYAFNSDEAALTELLSNAEKDVYSGVFWQGELIGVFFLRGWDDGYEKPSFGVLIGEKHRGRTLLHLTVDAGKVICKLKGINQYMVKIHPDNVPLANVGRMGFYETGVEESTGNVIFHLDF